MNNILKSFYKFLVELFRDESRDKRERVGNTRSFKKVKWWKRF